MWIGGTWRRGLLAGFVTGVVALGAPSFAAATSYYVSPGGSDAASGSADEPLQTISRAAQLARPGDVVRVASGTYPETVTIPRGANHVTFEGQGPTPPVIDGEGTRRYGFVADSARNVTVRGFAIRRQTEVGIYLLRASDVAVTDNEIDHVGSAASAQAAGIRISFGSGVRVAGNTVHSIGPGAEARGIWLLETTRAVIEDNTVYLARVDCIRDWHGLDNRITGNRVFLCWAGLALNTSTGSVVTNNYSYDNTIGILAKHVSYPTVLDYWQLSQPHWTRIWQNTVWRSSSVSLALGQSGEPFDYVDVRNNIFQDAGLAYIHDMPGIRGGSVTVDGNAYAPTTSRPRLFYKAGWDAREGVIGGFDEYRAQLGWDQSGRVLDPQLADPARGDLSYASTSPAAEGSAQLPDGSGNGLGATGITPAATTWTPYQMSPIDSSSAGSWWTQNHLDNTSDDDQDTYWLSETGQNEFVTFDFGRTRTFDHLILTVFSHMDKRNVRGYRFEVSDDLENWRTVLEGENPDAAGSSYKYELPQPATGRYLRFRLIDTFCDSYAPRSGCGQYFVFSDLRAGSLNTEPQEEEGPLLDLRVIRRQSEVRVLRTRKYRVSLTCAADCGASAVLRTRGGVAVARGAWQLEAGDRRKVALRLTTKGRRVLRARGSSRLRLVAAAESPAAVSAERATKVKLAG